MTFQLRYGVRTIELGGKPFSVGRNESCDLSVEDDTLLSRRHATFSADDDGVIVEDLASRNGVMVNGARITGKARLDPGDHVLVGLQRFNVLASKKEAATARRKILAPRVETPIDHSTDKVDYVTIGGSPYVVVPQAEYLRLCRAVMHGAASFDDTAVRLPEPKSEEAEPASGQSRRPRARASASLAPARASVPPRSGGPSSKKKPKP